jgi:cytochrome c553
MPRLAGISKPYFVEQMNAFRSGARKETVMHQLARGYSEEQIGELADYFSSRN